MSSEAYIIETGMLFMKRTPKMILHNHKRSVSVIITCHDIYTNYLDSAIQSVKNQTSKPDEIILVLDNTDTTIKDADIKYIYVNYNNPFLSRKDGFEAATSEVIIFLDSDDRLSKDYILCGLAIKTDDNIVYSDLLQFGTTMKAVKYPNHIENKKISLTNFLHVGCLVSKEMIICSQAFEQTPPNNCHEDWVFWRKLVRRGCECIKQKGVYFARQHYNNRSSIIRNNSYYDIKGISTDSVCFIKIDGGLHERSIIEQWPIRQRQIICDNYQNIDCSKIIICADIDEALANTTADYLCFYTTETGKYINLEKLLREFNSNTLIVHDKNFKPWEATIVVADYVCEKPIWRNKWSKITNSVL